MHGLPDLVFAGTVVESGDSNVTAEWTSPPQPGLALRFSVEEVRVGEVGSSVVIHTPGGPANSGNCSIGVVTGQQLVTVSRGDDGFFVGGMCSIVPIRPTLSDAALTEAFGPVRGPSTEIAPEQLTAGVVRPPDAEDVGAQLVFEERDGTLDFAADVDPRRGDTIRLPVLVVLASIGLLALGLIASSTVRSHWRTRLDDD